MVWGGMSYHGHTELVAVNQGRMTSDRSIQDILEPNIIPYGPFVGDTFIFMQDNAINA